MNKKEKIILSILVVGIILISGWWIWEHETTKPIVPSLNMEACSQDSDCIVVKGDCCGCDAGGTATAINKNFENEWYEKLSTDCICTQVISNHPSCFKEARCVNNKCVLKSKEKGVNQTIYWEIYKNEKYGYEVKYPGDWQIQKQGHPDTYIFKIYKTFDKDQYSCIFTIFSDEINYFEELKIASNLKTQGYYQEETAIDNVPAIKFSHPEYPEQARFFLKKERKDQEIYFRIFFDVYRVGTHDPIIVKEHECNEVFNQMLSIFRLIEPEEIPVDETSDWKTYQEKPFQDLQPHKPWKFEFKYPKEFVLKQGDHLDFPSGSFLKAHRSGAGVWSAKVAISVILPQSAYPSTNFQSAWVTIAYDPDIANLPNCQELERNQIVEKMTESQVINEVTWYKGMTGGAALGTAIKSKVYHTLHNDMCYEVSLHLATTNIGNLDPALDIKPVDESEVWSKLESVLSTFRFLE